MQIAGNNVDNANFLTSLYLGLMNRQPDEAGFKYYLDQLDKGYLTKHELGLLFVRSQEFANANRRPEQLGEFVNASDSRLFEGYDKSELSLFTHFDTSEVKPATGFLTEWIGSRVRLSSLWRSAIFDGVDASVRPIPIPSDYHADCIEWIGTLKSVLAAKGSFSVMEVGAGHGPWLAASCAAARNRGIRDIAVCGVEADPGRFELLRQNMTDNYLFGKEIQLFQAAVGPEQGRARWPRISQPAEDSGARILREGDKKDTEYLSIASRFEDFIDVEIIPFAPLLNSRERWDLVHIDVQGIEVDLCNHSIEDLTKRARYVVIGTHARWIDGDLLKIFFGAGWRLENEKPAKYFNKVYSELNCDVCADGTQVWRNLKL